MLLEIPENHECIRPNLAFFANSSEKRLVSMNHWHLIFTRCHKYSFITSGYAILKSLEGFEFCMIWFATDPWIDSKVVMIMQPCLWLGTMWSRGDPWGKVPSCWVKKKVAVVHSGSRATPKKWAKHFLSNHVWEDSDTASSWFYSKSFICPNFCAYKYIDISYIYIYSLCFFCRRFGLRSNSFREGRIRLSVGNRGWTLTWPFDPLIQVNGSAQQSDVQIGCRCVSGVPGGWSLMNETLVPEMDHLVRTKHKRPKEIKWGSKIFCWRLDPLES